MKKGFVTTLLALACTAAAFADTLVATPNSTAATATQNNKKGFTLDFGKSATFQLGDTTVTDFSGYESLTLTSVSISTSATNYGDAKLAVYKIANTSPDSASWDANPGIKNFESYVGVSTSVGTYSDGVDGVATFTFDTPLTLSPTAWYAFMFVNKDAAETAYSTGNNLGAAATGVGISTSFIAYNNVSGAGLSWGDMMNAGNSGAWNNTQTAVATYTFAATPVAIPEPATATLSLLALAGLAARRRR